MNVTADGRVGAREFRLPQPAGDIFEYRHGVIERGGIPAGASLQGGQPTGRVGTIIANCFAIFNLLKDLGRMPMDEDGGGAFTMVTQNELFYRGVFRRRYSMQPQTSSP